jgi:hypothetical protein
MDTFLASEVKRFVIFQWAALHAAAVEVQFVLSHDCSVHGTLLSLVPRPASSGAGFYTQPRATVADGTMDLRSLTTCFSCTRPGLLLLSEAELTRMADTLRGDLDQWNRLRDGKAQQAIELRRISRSIRCSTSSTGGWLSIRARPSWAPHTVPVAAVAVEAVAIEGAAVEAGVAEAVGAAPRAAYPAAPTKVPEMGTM